MSQLCPRAWQFIEAPDAFHMADSYRRGNCASDEPSAWPFGGCRLAVTAV